jgi:hypothetical protein
MWHASHELLDAIPVFEAWDMQIGVFFLPNIVIVRLHALLLHPTLDLIGLFRPRQVSQTGSSDCFVGSSQGSPERPVAMAQQ